MRDRLDTGRSDDLDITVRLVRKREKCYVRIEVSHTAPGWPDESDWSARFTGLDLTPATFGTRRSDDYEGMWAEIDTTPHSQAKQFPRAGLFDIGSCHRRTPRTVPTDGHSGVPIEVDGQGEP